METATIKVKQLVLIRSLAGKAASNEFELWDGIVGEESFPATQASAFYQLTLRQEVATPEEVDPIRHSLTRALECLSHVWRFAGGCLMLLQDEATVVTPLTENNTAEVKERLLAQRGQMTVTASFSVGYELAGTYEGMPLQGAIGLCRRAREDAVLQALFRYHYLGCVDKYKWFVELYKVRDTLKEWFRCEKRDWRELDIGDAEWGEFGKILCNYDLRHPGRPPRRKVTDAEIARARQLAFDWVKAYLGKTEPKGPQL